MNVQGITCAYALQTVRPTQGSGYKRGSSRVNATTAGCTHELRKTSCLGRQVSGVVSLLKKAPHLSARNARATRTRAVANLEEESSDKSVTISNEEDDDCTVITISTETRPGLLNAVAQTLNDLGLNVNKAVVDTKDNMAADKFFVCDGDKKKILDDDDLHNIILCLRMTVDREAMKEGTLRPITRRYMEAHSEDDTIGKQRSEHLYNLLNTYIPNDVLSIQESIVNHVEYTIARSRYRFDDSEAYQATAHSVRDRLIESWNDTQRFYREEDPKRVYYISMEFLTGRTLLNSIYNLGIKDAYQEALLELGYNLETIVAKERDAALGNGGLGRLAACFLDSMATLDLPAWGYGIRYQYGMFRQTLVEGFQREAPDYWLNFGNPWEIMRPNVTYTIKFYGHVSVNEDKGRTNFTWNAGEEVEAVAYDNPIPGWDTPNVNNLRLWSALPTREFDLESFNTGDYISAILSKQRAETLSAVLYPDDRTYQGKELRLKQQHFLVSATLQDILRRYRSTHDDFDQFADKVALQLNDTHPTIGIPEMMRLLMDVYGLGWTKSWEITTKVYAFTNHTVLPEALEKWPVELVESLLPRHMQIIYDINWRFLQELRGLFGEDYARMAKMSIIEEGDRKSVRMAHLALVACHTVNGVAAIHSELIKETIFKDFYAIMPQKFQNKTNGVTQRRWLAFCNPELSKLITETLGTEAWIKQLDLLSGLREHADDPEFQARWKAIKKANKAKLAETILDLTGVKVSEDALFDIQVKRIHEYKRQLLNILSVITRYDEIKKASPEERKNMVPRVVVIGGKAAPGYDLAKRIIKLVNAVGDKVNNDPEVGDLLKLIFLPDYNVSLAERIIPASELSQHISTAGTEASGTSNMKFAMNGCLILGTMDGANVEIAEEIGEENMFIFGARTHEINALRAARQTSSVDPRFHAALKMLRDGEFGWADFFEPIIKAVEGTTPGSDFYLLGPDYASYLEAQQRVTDTYVQTDKWTKMSILSVAGSGKFSSDRTIEEYARDIWKVKPCRQPAP
ncbi:Acid phosphatase pho1 [Cymbomonas tetramitiformis]|uniref:Alpha-1,4 glucan phosphorylase n=1 Tax=Cymbomonas tetramitiformis TaxID=36881 RepID=A0AAE0GW13_9CHLO|nr:Acid phosphatase pho1 [Cymbomonas tetramitiformis]